MPKQIYKYRGEEFVITKPNGCAMKVTKGRYTAVISIHAANLTYFARVSMGGVMTTLLYKGRSMAHVGVF